MRQILFAYSVKSKVNDEFTAPMFFKSERDAAYSFIKFIRSVPYEDKGLFSLFLVGFFDTLECNMESYDKVKKIDIDYYSHQFYGNDEADEEEDTQLDLDLEEVE